ncbi:DNA mismatch repair protein msh6 [Linderina pennispora]|nr:DNA mismatch repair protein msh6 [Linderina pennispora]
MSLEQLSLSGPEAWDGMAGLSQPTWRALKNTCAPGTDWIALTARKEFWDVPTLTRELEQAFYFDEKASDMSTWPVLLRDAAENDTLALTAVGGLISYLRTLKLDKDLVSLKNFSTYQPMQNDTALVLDGPTISNLDLFTLSSESGGAAMSAASKIGSKAATVEGTLFALLNHALTPFGRRLLSRWTCHPLKSASAINARLDVVEYLMSRGEVADTICTTLRSLADLERVLSRVHSGRCKVADFISLLAGLGAADELVAALRSSHGEALPARLQSLLAMFPPIGDLLSQINAAFDQTMAANEGRLLPFPGADSEYDKVLVQLTELDAWFDQHLKENRKKFNSKSIDYKHMGKEPYQLEMPASVKVPDSYFKLSGTKAVNRYWSPELRTKVQERAEALETKSMVLDSYQTRLYTKFDRHYALLMKAVSVVSELDCLVALTVASSSLGTPLCRPEILEPADNCGGYIEFRQLRHPCVALSGAISDFVANDIVLGRHSESSMMSNGDQDDGASMILLTGPNMGGKSTLLRQLCLGVILAQLGCYVPAQSARITPVDRLFTRIGARDHLLAGRSTFMVEMAETATILRYATPHSLVVLDELGRGTSTHDGEAVAFGVLHGLCARLGCLGLFSTHYGLLAESLLKGITSKSSGTVEPHLRPMFMACAVNEEEHRVTFLYRLTRGVASKSHGMNVAAMAGVPVSIVKQANEVAEKFEHGVKQRQKVRQMDVDVDESDDMMPLALQSDFANLLRMAALESKRGGRNGEHNEPVGGVAGAQRANENQYWPCIVNHLRRIMH